MLVFRFHQYLIFLKPLKQVQVKTGKTNPLLTSQSMSVTPIVRQNALIVLIHKRQRNDKVG